MAQKTDVKCMSCGHAWTSHAKLENIEAGKVACKKCGKKDLRRVQPAPTGDGTPSDGPKPPTDPDAERKEVAGKLALAKSKLEAANTKRRDDGRAAYLECELTDEELEEWFGLERRARSGNPKPPLFPEDMNKLADFRVRAENNEQEDLLEEELN